MTSRYEVLIGSTKLSSIDKDLLILDVAYSQMETNEQRYTTANLDGYDIARTYAGQQQVTVTFELHIYDIAKRNEVCQKVNAWADSSSSLRTNDRKDQYLEVYCKEHAVIESVKNWTDPLKVVFVTTHIPYWQSFNAKVLTLSGKAGTLKLDGNVSSALVNVTVTAKAAFTAITIGVGTKDTSGYTSIVLNGISVPKGKKLVVSYTNNRYLKITADGKSVLNKLQSSSTDLLLAPCGADTPVSVSIGNVTTEFRAKGLWL